MRLDYTTTIIGRCTIPQAHPTAKGHFPHEGLPRLLYLLQHMPLGCEVLVAADPFVERFIDLLPSEQRARVVRWQGGGHVHHATNIYVANEGPYCETKNPHLGR